MSGRVHLIGLDKPSAPPLRLAADPIGMLRWQASTHERNRLESVAEMLALVGILSMKRVLGRSETVSVSGAIYQWGAGSRTDRTVGAHCLPGQLRFNGSALHDNTSWTPKFLEEHGLKPLALDSKVRNVSARTEVTDGVVNETDSLLEKMDTGRGLKSRFANAAHQIAERVSFQASLTLAALAQLVSASVSHYRLGASFACEERLDWLRLQVRVTLNPPDLEKRRRQVVVVEEYLKVIKDHSFIPYFETRAGIEELVGDVVQQPR